jgi:hypothetical protein
MNNFLFGQNREVEIGFFGLILSLSLSLSQHNKLMTRFL